MLPRNLKIRFVMISGLFGSLMLNGPAYGAEWSVNEVQIQYGVFEVPAFAAPAGGKQGTFNFLVQSTSSWSWGQAYFFTEFVSARTNRRFNYQREDLYTEIYITLSSAKLLGMKYGGIINDIGMIQGMNYGVDSKFLKYLPGMRVSWNVPGFAFFNTDVTAFLDANPGISSGGAPSETDSWMFDFNWGYPFEIGGQRFSIEGHVERIAGRKNELGFAVPDWILGQPQFRWDIGHAIAGQKDKIMLGVEWQFWINKQGDPTTDENAFQALLIWRL